jgi:olefin beta-lactone synthetase
VNISELFFSTALKLPDRIALIEPSGKEISFSDFRRQVQSTAAYLRGQGVQKGDRILVFIPISTDLYRFVMAIFQIGATAVFIDEWVSLERLRLCCKIADCKAFIAPWKIRFLGFFIPEIRAIPIKLSLKYDPSVSDSFTEPVEANDTALITFTTGSTGTPKAANRTHAFLRFQFEALTEKMQPAQTDIVLTTLPIVLLLNFGSGATSVLTNFNARKPQKIQPAEIAAQIDKFKINVLIASPFFVNILAKSNPQGIRLRKVFTGGAPVFPEQAILYKSAFPEADIQIVYGSTEAEPISSISAEKLAVETSLPSRGGLAVGRVYEKTQLRIIEIDPTPIPGGYFEKKTRKVNEIGEIVVAGDHVNKQYFQNEKAFVENKIVAPDGTIWHRTGDAGFLTAEGDLYLTGRCSQMIFQENMYISPFLVENTLENTKGIEAGTVLLLNQKIVIIAEKKASVSVHEAQTEIQKILPFEIHAVKFVKKIPRDPRHNSKIDYAKLLTQFQ